MLIMIEVRTKFNLSSGKLFKVLINDRFEENQISTHMIEMIQEDEENQRFCHYYGEGFYLQFECGPYIDDAECRISPLKGHEVVFGKLWIDERRVSYNHETCILQFFEFGVRY